MIGPAFARVDKTLFDRFPDDFFPIEAAAIVADFDYDLAGPLLGFQKQPRRRMLSVPFALRRLFNAVIQRVAHHVHQRIGQFFDDGPVELDMVALRFHLDGFAEVPRQISRQALHTAE
jgi:hypothetical protein